MIRCAKLPRGKDKVEIMDGLAPKYISDLLPCYKPSWSSLMVWIEVCSSTKAQLNATKEHSVFVQRISRKHCLDQDFKHFCLTLLLFSQSWDYYSYHALWCVSLHTFVKSKACLYFNKSKDTSECQSGLPFRLNVDKVKKYWLHV